MIKIEHANIHSMSILFLAAIPVIDLDNTKYQQHSIPPTFIEPLRSLDAFIDATVVFECILVGEPKPYVVWERDGIELCQGDSLSNSRSNHYLYRLTLRHVQLCDSGNYACRATNIGGEATSVADLCVFSNAQQQQQEQEQQQQNGKYDRKKRCLQCYACQQINVDVYIYIYIYMQRETASCLDMYRCKKARDRSRRKSKATSNGCLQHAVVDIGNVNAFVHTNLRSQAK
jgi:hypothetical protein